MKKHNLAFIDVETTGFDCAKHEIIELGVVVARQIAQNGAGPKLEIIHELEYKIKPKHIETAEPNALRVNGYNEGDWLFALDLEAVMKDFATKVADATFVAHNMLFDWRFIDAAFAKSGVRNSMHYGKLDTLSMAFTKLYHDEKVQSFKLESLAEYFGVKNEKAHTALSDAKTTFEIYKKMLEIK
ncbi:MAG: hypothetical protein A2571_02510 [Candidatus Vogelbacteria bacterium RIFOXYD1_FULL_44_32]|uniref:Exonuclease domain-containing protein n=1 Tax=Candidatus Vogelbacteria bacterium RIFOXYD1_FULL_44_32 TaxID=1802438 RepID=A0A1G2QDM0_9BACT|nr:MAG: hypothetical protein A2571_02510 [Candidatus Vogelbacteria bacterium RIFOXYD1_FULL_44_32]